MVIGIAGATGFIGSYLSRYLAERRRGSICLLSRSGAAPQEFDGSAPQEFDGSQVMRGDLGCLADCERFVSCLDVIYYLAHTNSPVDSDGDQVSDAICNLIPLLNLIRAVERAGNRPHVVYFSSGGAVYAPKRDGNSYRETDKCDPVSSYGIQKLAAEQYLRLATRRGHLTAAVLRVGNAYGALPPLHRSQGLIGVAINNVLHNRPVRVFGSLQNVRDYVHLEDICSIAALAGEPRERFMILNVGSGKGHSVQQVLRLIEDCCGCPLEIETDDSRGRQLTDWVVLNTSRARREYGWSTTIDLRLGISAMISEQPLEERVRAATV